MPFKSKAQLRTCYSKKAKGQANNWNCDEFLNKTESVCCLPEKKGDKIKSRCMKNGERVIGSIKVGPRGGKFFTIQEKDSRGVVCIVKVYLPR
jgi:hypothetical protein